MQRVRRAPKGGLVSMSFVEKVERSLVASGARVN